MSPAISGFVNVPKGVGWAVRLGEWCAEAVWLNEWSADRGGIHSSMSNVNAPRTCATATWARPV